MKDEDIHAFGPPRPATPPLAPQPWRLRVWLWILIAVAALLLLLTLAGAAAIVDLLDSSNDGLRVTFNGLPWSTWSADPDFGFWGALGVAAAVMALLLVLPVVLMLVLLSVVVSVGLALLAVVGALLLAAVCVLLVVALALSPLWLAVLLLWLLLRPRRQPALASRPGPATAQA